MRKIAVTGAGGYIGTSLVPMLLEHGYHVVAIDRFFFGKELLELHPHLEFLQLDSRQIEENHLNGIDAVIDLVAISNDPSGEHFQDITYQVNCQSRVNTAKLAKKVGVQRYILPSSCSIYGFQEDGVIADETSETNPLTTYAKANEMAEKGVLSLADDAFTVTVLRQATVYGFSPRMRFDLAINGMTYGAWADRKLPLMRDGTQWRPMVHVRDTAAAQIFMLEAESGDINGQIFNVGSDDNNYQLGTLAETVAGVVGPDVKIEWYGDADHRSYQVSFKKISELGFKAKFKAADGALEILTKLDAGELKRDKRTITLEWYQQLTEWSSLLKKIEINGKVLDL